MKLEWYTDNEPDKVQWEKDKFMDAVSLHFPPDFTHSDVCQLTASALPYRIGRWKKQDNPDEPKLASAG